jgi:hypothetical protein
LKSGPYRSFNELGHPVLEAEYLDGMLNGKMVTYVNGKVSDTRVYENDKEVDPNLKPKKLKEKFRSLFKKNSKKTDESPKSNSAKPEKKKHIFNKNKDKSKNTNTPDDSGTQP